ncbi:hypothetical protein EW146_g7065 [Bondarzewia mesenterica]|uniref:C3H1-type domain-containing protein n=1 Tax=Bondarzewia mesenterica TaxID=1095465 RepID=A0A4S4LLU0_9AGAM|nr:hypothetical protein EW146_g7065 [Bondarzewia mesenterica]
MTPALFGRNATYTPQHSSAPFASGFSLLQSRLAKEGRADLMASGGVQFRKLFPASSNIPTMGNAQKIQAAAATIAKRIAEIQATLHPSSQGYVTAERNDSAETYRTEPRRLQSTTTQSQNTILQHSVPRLNEPAPQAAKSAYAHITPALGVKLLSPNELAAVEQSIREAYKTFRQVNTSAVEDIVSTPVQDLGGYRPLSYKTAPCKHYSTRQWCPMGENCHFIHDPNLPWFPEDSSSKSSSIGSHDTFVDGRGSVKKATHCWAYVQGICVKHDCQYRHPEDIRPYIKYTPCLLWPHCPRGHDCPFKHRERLDSDIVPGSVMRGGTVYFPINPPLAQTAQTQVFNNGAFEQYGMVSPLTHPDRRDNLWAQYGQTHQYQQPSVPGQAPATDKHAHRGRQDDRDAKVVSATDPTLSVDIDAILADMATFKQRLPISSREAPRKGHARRMSIAVKESLRNPVVRPSDGVDDGFDEDKVASSVLRRSWAI